MNYLKKKGEFLGKKKNWGNPEMKEKKIACKRIDKQSE
jgi:hypothetical protein